MTAVTVMIDMIETVIMSKHFYLFSFTHIRILLYVLSIEFIFILVITMMVDTEVAVVEEVTTETVDHLHTTKIDHAMRDHARVLILHVSKLEILSQVFDLSTLSGNPVFFFKAYFINLLSHYFFFVFFLGFFVLYKNISIKNNQLLNTVFQLSKYLIKIFHIFNFLFIS